MGGLGLGFFLLLFLWSSSHTQWHLNSVTCQP